MNIFVALLRGINVSGQKKIKMADLLAGLESVGLAHAKSYIQSGNVVFLSAEKDTGKLETIIAEMIREKFEFEVQVFVYAKATFEQIVQQNPFQEPDIYESDKIYFSLLKEVPSAECINRLETGSYQPEEYKLLGRLCYVYAANGYGRGKLNNNFLENKLKVTATTRNLRTMEKLLAMMRDADKTIR